MQNIIEDAVDGDDVDETESWGDLDARHPALKSINDAQADALTRFVREGLDSRRDLLEWLHDLQFWTLGEVRDAWYVEFATSGAVLDVALPDVDVRPRSTLMDDARETARRRLATKFLRPMYRRGFRELRQLSREVTGDRPMDADASPYRLLRPSLDEYRTRQSVVLDAFLEGFDEVEQVETWLQRTDHATYGELDHVPGAEEFDHRLLTDPATRRVVLGDEPEHVRTRERLAARFLLPAFNGGVYLLGSHAGESNEEQTEDWTIPDT
jgi:hypothetical protein